MKSKISKAIGVLGAMATAATFGKLNFANAQTSAASKGKDSNLADEMINKNLFEIDNQTNEIKIDNDALVETLKSEITEKMRDRSLPKEQKNQYQVILDHLRPGSFGDYHENANNNQAMHFDKK